jgi:hypothetical protein
MIKLVAFVVALSISVPPALFAGDSASMGQPATGVPAPDASSGLVPPSPRLRAIMDSVRREGGISEFELDPFVKTQTSPPGDLHDWTRVQGLKSGQHLLVDRKGFSWLPKEVQGEFVSANESNVVLNVQGTERTVSRQEVKKLNAVKPGSEDSVRIGRRLMIAGVVAVVASSAILLIGTVEQANALSNGRVASNQDVARNAGAGLTVGLGGLTMVIVGATKVRHNIEKVFESQ